MSEVVLKKYQIKARVIRNKRIKDNFYNLVLSAPQIASSVLPGQFVNIKIEEVFLRRPFSVQFRKKDCLGILYEVVGKGTFFLSQKKENDSLDIIGPLGRGFSLPKEKNREIILVAGGIGIAGLFFLAEKLLEKQKIKVLIGAKTKNKLLCEKELKDLGCEVFVSTDDGSKGFKGKVTELLKKLISAKNNHSKTIYACGPYPMLKELAEISHALNILTWVLLDQHMACGFGACLGCSIETKYGFKRVCKDGPVFNAEEIIW